MKKIFLIESSVLSDLTFLGYHSSRKNVQSGYYKGPLLDEREYGELIRSIYADQIGYDENVENDDIAGMNQIFKSKGWGFTFISKHPIEASVFQYTKYKYGDNLYKVYGTGYETLVDDPNELNAEIVISSEPLYFEKIN